MKKVILLTTCFLFIATCCLAQDGKTLKTTLQGIASDLSILHEEIQSINRQAQESAFAKKLPAIRGIKITKENAKFLAGASHDSEAIFTAMKGQEYQVVDQMGAYYAADFGKPVQGLMVGWINSADVVPVAFANEKSRDLSQDKSTSDQLYEKIMISVKSLKDKYSDNPYVKVSGFSVDIGLPPSVNISFEFK